MLLASTFLFAQEDNSPNQTVSSKTIQELKFKTKQDRFHYLDSLSLVLEEENYRPPYEDVQLELIDLGIQIDSLDRVAYQAIGLAWYYSNIVRNPKKSIKLTQRILIEDTSNIRDFYVGLLYRELGDAYFFTGENTFAIGEYEKAIRIFEALQNKQILAETLMYLSAPQSNTGDFVNAINTMNRSLHLFEETGDKYNVTGMRIEMGLLFSKYGFVEEARQQYDLLIEEGFANDSQLSAAYINKANLAKTEKNYQDYFNNIELAQKHAKSSDRLAFIMPTILLSKAEVLFILGRYDEGNKVFETFNDNYSQSTSSLFPVYKNVRAEKYRNENKLKQAINELEELLRYSEERNDWSEIAKTKSKLVELYTQTNQLNLALSNQSSYLALRDSIEEDKKIKALSYYKTLFETEKKDKQITKQESEIEILHLENQNKQKLILIVLVASIFSIGSVWFFRKYLQTKREQALQQNFSQQLLRIQEEERLKISRDLHDSVGQSLSLLKRNSPTNSNDENDKLLATSIQELREVTQAIYPYTLKKFGLSYALENMVANINKTMPINFKLKIQDLSNEVNENYILQIYRLLQEATNNIIKHAEAKNVVISVMKRENEIHLKVVDDGNGFDVKYKLATSKSFGLQTMHQRIQMLKGKLEIQSNLKGTEISALIPIV